MEHPTCGRGCPYWKPTYGTPSDFGGNDDGYCHYDPVIVNRDRKCTACHHHPGVDAAPPGRPREVALLCGPGSIGMSETEKHAILRYVVNLEHRS